MWPLPDRYSHTCLTRTGSCTLSRPMEQLGRTPKVKRDQNGQRAIAIVATRPVIKLLCFSSVSCGIDGSQKNYPKGVKIQSPKRRHCVTELFSLLDSEANSETLIPLHGHKRFITSHISDKFKTTLQKFFRSNISEPTASLGLT